MLESKVDRRLAELKEYMDAKNIPKDTRMQVSLHTWRLMLVKLPRNEA